MSRGIFDGDRYVIQSRVNDVKDFGSIMDADMIPLYYVKHQHSLEGMVAEGVVAEGWGTITIRLEGVDGASFGEIIEKPNGPWGVHDAGGALRGTVKVKMKAVGSHWVLEDPDGHEIATIKGDWREHHYDVLNADKQTIASCNPINKGSYHVDLQRSDVDPFVVLSYIVVLDHDSLWRQGAGLEIDKEVIFKDLQRYYQSVGIDATLLDGESPDTITQETAIQIKGRNVDLVLLPELPDPVYIQRGHIVKHSRHVETSTNRRTEVFHFIMKRLGNRSEQDLRAEMTEEKKGWIRKKLVGIRWEGGQLASLLNEDTTLRNMILKSQTSALHVEPDANYDCIRIILAKQIKVDIKRTRTNFDKYEFEIRTGDFPSIETFDIVDKIAQHVQSIESS